MPLLERFEHFRDILPLAVNGRCRRRLKVLNLIRPYMVKNQRLTLKFQRCPVVPEIQVFPGQATIFPFC